jgi:hypothetical protein
MRRRRNADKVARLLREADRDLVCVTNFIDVEFAIPEQLR